MYLFVLLVQLVSHQSLESYQIKWVDVPKVHKDWDDQTLYSDIISRSPDKTPRSFGDKTTTAHETGHFINNNLRNQYVQNSTTFTNAFYVGGGKACVLAEPKIKKSWIRQFVPEAFHTSRYDLYVVNQTGWEDRPLYIFDEWSCYVLDALVNIELAEEIKHKTDIMNSLLEFSVYSIALAMAVEKYDPDYFKSNKQFREFMKFQLNRSLSTYEKGVKIDKFNWDGGKMYKSLQNNKSVNKFVTEKLGITDWLQR